MNSQARTLYKVRSFLSNYLGNRKLKKKESVLDIKIVSFLSTVFDGNNFRPNKYVGVLISLWIFLFSIFPFAAQPKEFFLDGLKKLEQRSHKCVELRREYVE
jgi:hypothetical protein